MNMIQTQESSVKSVHDSLDCFFHREEVKNKGNIKEEETNTTGGEHGNWSFKVKEKINEARTKQKQREEV